MTANQHNEAFEKVWADLIQMTVKTLRYAVNQAGLEDTGDLLESIQPGVVNASKNWIEGSVYYDALLRVKDIKTLHYTTIPPLAPLIEWVERQGVNKFPFVPGYPNGVKKAGETASIIRIAEGIRWFLKSYPNVTRNYRGRSRTVAGSKREIKKLQKAGIYNEVVNEIVMPEFWIALRGFAISYTIATMYETFGVAPVNLEEKVMNTMFLGRSQQGANARETYLARNNSWYQADPSYQHQDAVDELLNS